MAKVPEINTKAEAKRVNDALKPEGYSTLYRDQVVKALRTIYKIADKKTMQRVPVTRLANPLDTWTKIKISVKKFAPGFLLGAIGFLAETVATGGIGAITWGVTAAAAGSGVVTGLGLTSYKYVKETRKDKKLDKEVRHAERLRAEGYNSAQLDWIANLVTLVMGIAEAAGLDTKAALRQVYTSIELFGTVPQEVGEFLLTLSTVVEDGTARGGFTGAEIQSVLNEAGDVKDAIKRIQQLWDER